MLRIPYLPALDATRLIEAGNILDTLEFHPISCCNWAGLYPYAPWAGFQAAHNGSELFLHFTVKEDTVKADIPLDNGEVWTDSCVEFFISLDDSGYYNFEFTCIGKALLGFRKERPSAIHASTDILRNIRRYSTLGSQNFPEKALTTPWQLTVSLPVTALFCHACTSWQGLTARANVYKCGDKLPRPHYLSWSPIDTPRPDFHVPRCFSEILFD